MYKTHQNAIKRLLGLLGTASVALIILTMPVIGASPGASTNRDHPTALTSNDLKGDLDGSSNESFYSLLAGPGDLTITVDVKSTEGISVVNFELLDNDAAKSLASSYVQADGPGQSGRDVQTVKLDSRQNVVLLLRQNSGKGTYAVGFSGTAVSDAKPAIAPNTQVSNRFGLPNTGTLRIELADGSSQEFDLSLVKLVSIKP
jgi:hypothetical protein